MWFCIEVRFLHHRYHGRDDRGRGGWPPTPLRLFQAITAGALSGRWAVEERAATEAALRWLEGLGAPARVLGPGGRNLRPYRLAVPNNQADRHVPALRKGARLDDLLRHDKELKQVQPVEIGREPLVYAWPIAPEQRAQAKAAQPIVRRLVALGTGLDHAVADAQLCTELPAAESTEFEIREAPCTGTLNSLIARHQAGLSRLAGGGLRENLPPVRHDGGRARPQAGALLFSLCMPADADADAGDRPLRVEPETTAVLAYAVREKLASVLLRELARARQAAPPFAAEDVERLVLGRGAGPDDKQRRVSVLPLPSIGHVHADGFLRRVLVAVPGACPIAPDIVGRALSNTEITINGPAAAKRHLRLRLARSEDEGEHAMLRRYVGEARVWRTVSPIVLPGAIRSATGAEDSAERAAADAQRHIREAALVRRAIEDAGIEAPAIVHFRVRREPFGPHHPRADAPWQLPRNSQGRRWLAGKPRLHAEIVFATKRPGPLIIGDGRYLGLGLMEPVSDARRDVVVFQLAAKARVATGDRTAFLSAVRRALMSLSRRSDGSVPRLFSGHEINGAPAHSGRHEHAFLSGADLDEDGYIDALIVSAPWKCDHSVRPNREHAALFDRIVTSLETLRAGKLGIVSLVVNPAGAEDSRLVGPARVWESHAGYSATRPIRKGDDPLDVLRRDATAECRRRGLPIPEVELLGCSSSVDQRISARLRLSFTGAVMGPLALGRDSHQGGGLFLAKI